MAALTKTSRPQKPADAPYMLDGQVGFILRQVSQRHAAIFAKGIACGLTPTQWAAMAKLAEMGPCSQNLLGRRTAMDVATIKGVIGRLVKRGFAETRPDPKDGRLLVVALTAEGEKAVEMTLPKAREITKETLSPLTEAECGMLLTLLKKLC
jgi:MarR family transcriptional regulator, lower aerobic nicotinate degradation pathway regulator